MLITHPPRQFKDPEDWTPILLAITARIGKPVETMTFKQALAANTLLADEDKQAHADAAAASGDLTALAQLAAENHQEPTPEEQARLLKMAEDLAARTKAEQHG